MPRRPRTIPGPSPLSQVLARLRRPPRLVLDDVRSLSMTYAQRNDHFGARHFVKDDLPRIRYANPALDITVNKLPKLPGDDWEPKMELNMRGGQTTTISMGGKWSTSIFEELMNAAGGEPWQQWKKERLAQGLPVVEGLEGAKYQERLAEQRLLEQPAPSRRSNADEADPFANLRTKTGAAAVLP
ncbi:hypothetical protein OE88DRAFT_1685060 [Heliocybe sulcata]|uniref:Uncharacterized protein n=1 Tax=Heliocybe sulcata TaxID=5364 RepID=A0A5C3MVY1_9AGAM|nr:hypothetical protein OE88DRAFT_1685060 [Heliocybe sulcata]